MLQLESRLVILVISLGIYCDFFLSAQASNADFLCQYKFDFNKVHANAIAIMGYKIYVFIEDYCDSKIMQLFYEGITYLNRQQVQFVINS